MFVRGEMHCDHFGQGNNVKEVRWQVMIMTVVGVIVTGGTLRIFFYLFSAYKSYGLKNP